MECKTPTKRLSDLLNPDIDQLLCPEGFSCSCGKVHMATTRELCIGQGVLDRLPEMAEKLNINQPAIIADQQTWKAAGERVTAVLEKSGRVVFPYVMETDRPEPDEYWVGAVALQHRQEWDGIIAVGSGTINDICKVAANMAKLPLIVVATAPSMDGYASDTASMLVSNLKTTIPAKSPEGVILDTEILAAAPQRMLWAGLGDMLAKYVSICEWRISKLVTGEYYCPEVARLVRQSLSRCVQASEGLMRREPEAVGMVAEGLVLSGIAMKFAGLSRPASGIEHYFSHMWEMMATQKGEPHDLHGIQVGVGTLLALRIYEHIATMQPNLDQAADYARNFDEALWEQNIYRLFGGSAHQVIQARRDNASRLSRERDERVEVLCSRWGELQAIVREELPPRSMLCALMERIGAPTAPNQIGVAQDMVYDAFISSKDIRAKYIASTLLWDLGALESTADHLFGPQSK